MPYISIRTATETSNLAEKEQLANDITHNMSQILGKGEGTIMVDIQNADSLFLGGTKLNKAAVVEIMVFGDTSNDIKSKANDYICQLFEKRMNIPNDKVYVIFSDKNEWGYKGSFISK